MIKATNIAHAPIDYFCPSCGVVKAKEVKRSETLPLNQEPTIEDKETMVEIGCCSNCCRDVVPVFARPYKVINPGIKLDLEYSKDEDCYFAATSQYLKDFTLCA